jgi:hypothetical protein
MFKIEHECWLWKKAALEKHRFEKKPLWKKTALENE